jgi:hypothetical protein
MIGTIAGKRVTTLRSPILCVAWASPMRVNRAKLGGATVPSCCQIPAFHAALWKSAVSGWRSSTDFAMSEAMAEVHWISAASCSAPRWLSARSTWCRIERGGVPSDPDPALLMA